MDIKKKIPDTIDEYIADFPVGTQEVMQSIRNTVHQAVPGIKERISWGMPTFYMKKILVQFAGFKNHIGFFPGPLVIEELKEDLLPYKTSKGGIRFPYGTPVPLDLNTKIVLYNLEKERI